MILWLIKLKSAKLYINIKTGWKFSLEKPKRHLNLSVSNTSSMMVSKILSENFIVHDDPVFPAAVFFWDVTQRSPASLGERYVTQQKRAAKETNDDLICNLKITLYFTKSYIVNKIFANVSEKSNIRKGCNHLGLVWLIRIYTSVDDEILSVQMIAFLLSIFQSPDLKSSWKS